jgi:hypothetical protein
MSRSILAVLLMVLTGSPAYSRDDVEDALAHSEALYYEARFQESIQLLSRVDKLLQTEEGRIDEKINTKLQLALAHIGLNDAAAGKSFLQQLYALDPDHRLDPEEFSPKIRALADEAKAEAADLRCQSMIQHAQDYADAQDATALIELIRSRKATCPNLDTFVPAAAELSYKNGLDFYRKSDFPNALTKFRLALDLSPAHDRAAQYIDLIGMRRQVSVQRIFSEWQKYFTAGDFAKASAGYGQLESLDDADSKAFLKEIELDYRKAVLSLVEAWKRACTAADVNAMHELRAQALALLPNPSIGEDLLQQMTTCSSTDCLQMDAQIALARLKTRVDPDIPSALVGASPVTLRLAVRVGVNGNVSVRDIQGGSPRINESVQHALAAWRFAPIMDPAGPRCADIDLPLLIRPRTAP